MGHIFCQGEFEISAISGNFSVSARADAPDEISVSLFFVAPDCAIGVCEFQSGHF